MKKVFLLVAVFASLVFVSCHHSNNTDNDDANTPLVGQALSFDTIDAQNCYVFLCEGETIDSNYVQMSFLAVWPKNEVVTAAVLKALFPDYSYSSIEEVRDSSLSPLFFTRSFAIPNSTRRVDTLYHATNKMHVNLHDRQITTVQHNNILTITNFVDVYSFGAAHGLFSERYVLFDIDSLRVVSLVDVIDTADLGRVLLRAVKELKENSDVASNLFEPNKLLPAPDSFLIDFDDSDILLTYPLYEIAPFSAGLPSIRLTYSFMQDNNLLTPYGSHLLAR